MVHLRIKSVNEDHDDNSSVLCYLNEETDGFDI